MTKAKKTSSPAAYVTIIVPVYNAGKYLQRCLDSLYAQTFQAFEVIAIDDGSTDGSLELLRQNTETHKNTQIITQENHGQGYARNRALERARGEYVLFVDADDFIDPRLLEKTVDKAREDCADVVHFNWQMLRQNVSGLDKVEFFNTLPFATKTLLGKECEGFLKKTNYFACDSLYKKTFLDTYNIRFGEGYIYEDNEFIVKVAEHASSIAVIDEPLYTVRMSAGSSTHSSLDTPRHYHDFMRAMRRSFAVLRPRSEYSSFYLAAYFLEKFIVYYERRVPRKYRRQYLHEFVEIMHEQAITAPKGTDYRFLRMCLNRRIFTERKYRLFYLGLLHKIKVLPAKAKVQSSLRKLQHK